MNSSLVAAALCVPVLVGVAPTAQAALLVTTAVLSGAAEASPNASPGTGTATVTYDDLAHTLKVQVTFSGLEGTVTAAHIHAPTLNPNTGTAGVVTTTPTFPGFPSGVTSGSYDETFDLTDPASWNPAFITAQGSIANAEATLAAALASEKAYLNVHSSVYGSGEIRGFLAVPEPGMTALWSGLGLAAFGFARCFRSRPQ